MAEDSREKDLLSKIADKDEEALRDLFDRYHQKLFSYIFRLTKDQEISKDVIQETFLAIWKKADQYRGTGRAAAWIYRIAFNKAMNAQTALKKNLSMEDVGELRDMHELPDEKSERIEKKHELRSFLDQLSTEHRTVLELIFYHEFSINETAEIMNCPVGTIKSRLNYAKSYLKGELIRHGLSTKEML